ncbi:unnamed protein product [Prorocentrum cordatum]|uniref:PROP1-like PPR domain-containing protein n=1 Tax=Prorocentrum cordatum TaxID=2364126 RepID=A0ABN9S0G2_9DINO|nr:unnamed protein product [Polarella glacialis]
MWRAAPRPVLPRRALAASAGADGLFVAAQPRSTRGRERQPRRNPRSTGGAFPARPEVSPRRKRFGARSPGKQRRHGTDLEDLRQAARSAADAATGADASTHPAVASAFGAEEPQALRMREPQVRRLVRRPVASLPRTPQFFVRFGPLMSAEDLTHDAPSVMVESRRLIDDVLERRQALQSSPDYIAPDTPFWRLPAKARNKKPAAWRDLDEDGPEGARERPGAAGPLDASGVAEQLQGIVDITRASKRWKSEALAPGRRAAALLEEASDGAGREASEAAARRGLPGESLIAALRERAADFERTGVHPDLKESLEEALRHQPGTERAARLREMQACTLDFESLVTQGKASVANLNELVRAQALQGRMDEALRTHDAMKTHGYEPDDGTFVSLLLGAVQLRDPVLARRLFLKMREQLIAPTLKVYSALIKAHTVAGDVASAMSLVRKMEDERVMPDLVVHTVVIDGLVARGDLSKAWEEFHSIRTWKLIQPDEVLFTVMIKACAQAQEAERALNLLDDLRTCGLYPTDITYGELIHAMATSAYHARKAFDFFRQMQAEDMPLSPFIFEKLLQACRVLGDAKRAQGLILEMRQCGVLMQPPMFSHIVGLFATAMRRPKVTEMERLQNLRCTWHAVAEARRCCGDALDWTQLLNEVMGVYVAGGFSQHAVEMLQQYPLFGASPDAATYRHLLEMLGRDLQDTGRFFALWERLPGKPEVPNDLYHLALEVALETRSAKRTCAVLEEMLSSKVFPTPQLTDRLAKVGRHVTQVHLLVARFVSLNKTAKVAEAKREKELLQTHMDERELELAAVGLTRKSPTPEQEVRTKHFETLHKRGFFRRPWLPYEEYKASKEKGGEAYAKRRDRPRPNLLAA